MSPLLIRSAVMRMWDSELGGGEAPSPLGGGRRQVLYEQSEACNR